MDNKISSDLIRGHINTIILRTLYDGDKYGLEIIKVIEERSSGQYEIKQPTLYSALTRLSSSGLVEAYWGDSIAGGRRKYFKLTESGRELAQKNMSEWEYSRTVIDRLISEKEFDLSVQSANVVDFNLLKSSVSKPQKPQTEPNLKAELNDSSNLKIVEDKLNNTKKYATERDNKEKLQTLFDLAVKTPAQDSSGEQYSENEKPSNESEFDLVIAKPQMRINFDDLIEKAESDGIKLRISTSSAVKLARGSFYNKGLMLFFSLCGYFVAVFLQLLLVRLAFSKQLNFTNRLFLIYTAFFAAFPLISGLAAAVGFGKNSHKSQSSGGYLDALIVALNLVLVYLAAVLLLKIDLSGTMLFTIILLPTVLILQLPILIYKFSQFYSKILRSIHEKESRRNRIR